MLDDFAGARKPIPDGAAIAGLDREDPEQVAAVTRLLGSRLALVASCPLRGRSRSCDMRRMRVNVPGWFPGVSLVS